MTTPGYSARGLVMLNLQAGSGLLARYRPKRWWVVEGEIDFLRLCCVNPDDAVIGIRSGSIHRHSRLLDPLEDCEVIIATDADKAGSAYANLITAALFDGQMRRGVSIKRADLGG